MKRSFSFAASLAVGATALLAAAPAFAQDYYGGDEAFGALFGGGVCAVYACIGIFGILSLVLWVWMLIDLIMRQEHEFPSSTGNSKLIWILVMVGSWVLGAPLIAAIVYYFMVFKKIKRGSGGPPPGGGYPGGYQAPVQPAAPPMAPPAPQAPPMAPPASPAPPAPPASPAPPAV
jgi:hypothetical protein